MKRIKLKNNLFTLVDDLDFEWLNQWKWACNNTGYVSRRKYLGRKHKPQSICILLHREINQTPKGLDTDHINGDKLDNRRENLRTVTHQKNILIRGLQKNNTTGFKGLVWDKKRRKWLPRIKINGKNRYLGIFKDFSLAVLARKKAEEEIK